MRHSKFNIAEMFSNSSNGKTSDSKVVGTYLCIVGSITFLIGVITSSDANLLNTIATQSMVMIGSGTLLLGSKVVKPTTFKDTENETKADKEV